ncbi:MAG: hypothetical protein R2862_06245 [Thermoanaerobaculia bacterium]
MTRPGMRAVTSGALLSAVLLLFFGSLLDPRNALTARDMLEFHLPLRQVWANLSTHSFFPQWDPLAHGGQPLLSNPNYGALYPPSWLARFLPVTTTVALLAFLHAVLAACGAERLARRLGADRASALLAAVAFACGPTYLSLLHSLPLALGMSWLPWVLALAVEEAHPEAGRPPGPLRFSPALAAVFAMLVITGDPVLLVMTGLALAIFLAAPWMDLGCDWCALRPRSSSDSGFRRFSLSPRSPASRNRPGLPDSSGRRRRHGRFPGSDFPSCSSRPSTAIRPSR